MRIKLIEAQTISNIEGNLQSKIFPALSKKLNLQFDVEMGLNKTSYSKVYKGYFDDDKFRVPVDLEVNTTDRQIDEWNDPENHDEDYIQADCFMTLILKGIKYDIGAVNSKSPNMVVNAITTVMNDEDITFMLKLDNSKVKIPARDNSESHTEAEWRELFKTNQNTMDTTTFANWWNTVYPYFNNRW